MNGIIEKIESFGSFSSLNGIKRKILSYFH